MRGTTLDVVAAWKEALLLVALLVVAWKVRRLPAVTAADVLAGSYTAVIVLYWLIPQDVLGGDATARGELLALRHHLFPVAAYALGRLVGVAWEERGRVGGLVILSAVVVAVVGLARPRVRLAAGLARFGRSRVVRGAARPRLRGSLRSAGELGLQHRRRGQSAAKARVHVPVAAGERVRARRRADLRREPAAALVVGRPRGGAVRRAPVHAHAGRVRRARVRARAARGPPAAARAGRCRRSVRRRQRGVRRRVPDDRTDDELYARRSSRSCARTRSSRAVRGAGGSRRSTTSRPRATGRTCETAFASCSSTRRATASATLGSSRSGPEWRFSPASRPIPSSASMRASPESSPSSCGASRCCSGCGVARRGSPRRSRQSSRSACRRT